MQTSDRSGAPRNTLWIALATIAGVLVWLWRESLAPSQMAFSNDAPLGLMSAYSEYRWGNFFRGSWNPLVWLGSPVLPLQPSFSNLLYLILGPALFGKFIAPLSLFFLGIAVFVLCRTLGFVVPVATLAGLAAALNTNFVSHAGWGLGSRASSLAFAVFAFAALSPGDSRRFWVRSIFAGIAVGLSVVEGADVGAILSLYVAAYALFAAWLVSDGNAGRKSFRAVGRLAVVTVCAAWIASHIFSALVGTQIQGVAVMGETPEAKQQRWDFITGWSFPKLEVVRIAVPGIMGYRMDTPGGGAYWGNVGQDGTPQTRFNGGGEYAGVLVLLVAGWAVARALSRSDRQPFSARERRLIGFWTAVCVVSLLLSFGRFAPFYQLVYALPYLSTIRIPMKFLHVMHLGLFVLFAYGLQGLWRLYVEAPSARRGGVMDQVSAWWRGAAGCDRRWSRTLAGLAIGSLAIALMYAGSSSAVAAHIAQAGFPGEEGKGIAGFSIFEVGLAAGFVVFYAGLLAVISSGRFSNGRGTLAAALLGGVLVVDLARAAVPFIQHYDYQRRYASNPVLEFLARTPWEHRVTARYFPDIRQTFTGPKDGIWPAVQNQWMEQQFPYNEVHTADIWQMPRMPELDAAYLQAFRPKTPNDLGRIGRLWQLANVRYVITAAGFEAELNRLFDPEKQRFKPVLGFDLVPKPGSPSDGRVGLDDITAAVNPSGQYAVIENGAALPRARLYSQWQVFPEDPAALQRLEDPAFDPETTVVLNAAPSLPGEPPLVSGTNAVPGQAAIAQWKPRRVTLRTTAATPSVLLLNDRWDAAWHATVDGRETQILRANYLMRGVAVPAGDHTVEFVYAPSMRMLWVTLSAMAVALGLGVWLVVGKRRAE
ncbi:MAG: YfhO family protein, partial [Verrucomicrobiae bacterium]|nr:YfhO family protein [Verrucomicrobiae bacterium]